MAIVIPESSFSDDRMTSGERRALRTLRDGLDDSVLLWYQPKVETARRADVIAYVPDLGIILYEIKDWTLDNILEANPDVWKVRFGSSIRSVRSPFEQARDYYFKLNETLQKWESFIDKEGKYKGRVRIPIAVAVIFPNIRESDFIDRNLENLIAVERCLFRDDIRRIQEADSPKLVRDRLRKHFDPWWANEELSNSELDDLRGVLFPEITSVQKAKGGKEKVIILDRYQEQVARKIVSSGHSIVKGVAGSGKSLVLCSKALLIASEFPTWKILVTCYNVSLAGQLRYYIDSFRRRENLSLQNIEVVHFHAFCGSVFRKHGVEFPRIERKKVLSSTQFAKLSDVEQEKELDEKESHVVGEALQKIGDNRDLQEYQAILVDESQDFHPSWLKSLLLFLDAETNFLLLTVDPNQKIYPRSFTYKSAGITVTGGRKRSMRLPIGYRSTSEILVPASKLVVNSDWDRFYRDFVEDEGEMLPADNMSGPKGQAPRMEVKKDYADICSSIASDIKLKLGQGFRPSDFAVLYLVRKTGSTKSMQKEFSFGQKTDYVQGIRKALATHNIADYWLSESRYTKINFDQFRDAVTISTIFSAKGLEFEVVYLVGLELYPWSKRNKRENASLLYVAMTRAKSELNMYSTENTKYVREIKATLGEKRPSKWRWALRNLGN